MVAMSEQLGVSCYISDDQNPAGDGNFVSATLARYLSALPCIYKSAGAPVLARSHTLALGSALGSPSPIFTLAGGLIESERSAVDEQDDWPELIDNCEECVSGEIAQAAATEAPVPPPADPSPPPPGARCAAPRPAPRPAL